MKKTFLNLLIILLLATSCNSHTTSSISTEQASQSKYTEYQNPNIDTSHWHAFHNDIFSLKFPSPECSIEDVSGERMAYYNYLVTCDGNYIWIKYVGIFDKENMEDAINFGDPTSSEGKSFVLNGNPALQRVYTNSEYGETKLALYVQSLKKILPKYPKSLIELEYYTKNSGNPVSDTILLRTTAIISTFQTVK